MKWRLFPIRELAERTAVILLGKVVSLTSEWNPARTQILTRVGLEPEEALTSTISGDRIFFVQPGGRVGDLGSIVAETPRFTGGERVIVFLAPRRDEELGTIGSFHGKFAVERDAASGIDFAVRRASGAATANHKLTLEQLRSEVQSTLGK
jgi:hypothetical protein